MDLLPFARRKRALFAVFFLPGLALASWVTRTPAIRDSIGASVAQMGLVLFGLSVGSMIGILCSGPAVSHFGARKVATGGLMLIVLALLSIALGVALAQMLLVTLGLFFFGLGAGGSEIAINMEGAVLEQESGTHFLHQAHGSFSLGTLIGALLGMALAKGGLSVPLHLGGMALLLLLALFFFLRDLPPATGRKTAAERAQTAQTGASAWSDTRILSIGLIVLAMALAEGSANDWLPILMVDEYGMSQSNSAFVFVAFAAAMTLGRFGGGPVLRRFGRVKVVFGSALLGALGIFLTITGTNPIVTGFAVLAWGLGASLGFPLAISAAGDSRDNPEGKVKVVAMMGYFAFLGGPPLLGFIGEEAGLRWALSVCLIFVLLAALCARAVRPEK